MTGQRLTKRDLGELAACLRALPTGPYAPGDYGDSSTETRLLGLWAGGVKEGGTLIAIFGDADDATAQVRLEAVRRLLTEAPALLATLMEAAACGPITVPELVWEPHP